MKNYIEHYIIDNELINYSNQSSFFLNIDMYRFLLINKQLKSFTGKYILDIGSGYGKMINKEFENFFSLDISQKNNISGSFKIEGDAYCIPFKEKAFSAIVMSEILEHLEEPLTAMREAHRILKDDGRLILTVPYKERIKMHLCIHCNCLTPENGHLHSFDEKKLNEILSESGFQIKKIVKFENRILYLMHFFSIFRKIPIDFILFIDIIIGKYYNKYNKIMLVAEKRASGSVGRAHPSQG